MNLDERLQALTMNLELLSRDLEDMKAASRQDGQNIHALTGIAETTLDSIKRLERIALRHEERLDDLEQH
jgi:hypothetical protein